MGSNKNGLTRQRVVAAAEACFARHGVRRTSMVDIADELGVTRQTVYRLFDSKTAILEYMANKRIIVLARKLEADFKNFAVLEEALVEGSLKSVQAAREDTLLAEIFESSEDHDFEQFLFRGSPEIRDFMLRLWNPLIDEARKRGVLRLSISNDEAVEWIRNVHAMTALRSDYDDTRQRGMFQKFLLPSLIQVSGEA
ncbi:MAG TPA: helix-turn-helix domain-containing protein [Sphingobium sp.]